MYNVTVRFARRYPHYKVMIIKCRNNIEALDTFDLVGDLVNRLVGKGFIQDYEVRM